MKVKVALLTLSLFLFNLSFSQTDKPVAVLESDDIERYIETIVPMSKDLKELGIKMDGEEGNAAEQWATNAEARAILVKYGWNDSFQMEFTAITMAYAYLRVKQEIDKMPEDQRVQAEAMMPMFAMYLNMVHEDDVKLVESRMDDLNTVFKELEK